MIDGGFYSLTFSLLLFICFVIIVVCKELKIAVLSFCGVIMVILVA